MSNGAVNNGGYDKNNRKMASSHSDVATATVMTMMSTIKRIVLLQC